MFVRTSAVFALFAFFTAALTSTFFAFAVLTLLHALLRAIAFFTRKAHDWTK